MPRQLFLIFIACFFAIAALFAQKEIVVISYNIWYDNPSNTENPWSARKAGVIETLERINPDIFCVQEALINQVYDLEFDRYKHIGVGRDDGKKAGEFSAVFYDTTRFEILKTNTFWLSENPDIVGKKGWDAVCVRIATWVHLKEIETGKTFYVFNTHFDHIGDTARLESARLIKMEIQKIAKGEPVILCGDFNCKKGSKPYELITAENSTTSLVDARQAPQISLTGPEYSFVGSDFTGKYGDIIDHIFVTSNIKILYSRIDFNCGEKCPSDHLPVEAKLLLP
ncbi:MAG: endonuclease/exonuclease/phosphatase family protein [Bacteroidales bacterium]|nr:endonuclease/exonuclease/phosphatase family protein [Bacteroidales bacterium]